MPVIAIKDTDKINSLVDLHYDAFKGYLTSKLGKEYIAYFLTSLIASKDGIFFIYSENNNILGFVCGTTDIRKFWNKTYRRKLWRFAVITVLKQPLMIFNLLRYMWVHHEIDKCKVNAHMLSLVVSEEHRGKKIGSVLVEAFSSFLAAKGIESYLIPYTDANGPASRFYYKLGFRLVKTVDFFGYRTNCFIYDLIHNVKDKKMKVSVIVPTLNERGSIETVLNRISEQHVDEILVVDGRSTDGTHEHVIRLGYRLVFQEGRGLGKAIEKGIRSTVGDIIIIVDADGSHNPGDIPKLVSKITEGYDLVVASRYMRGPRGRGLFFRNRSSSYDDTFIREFGNRLFTYMCNKIYHIEIHDVLMGYKAFRRSIFEKVTLSEGGQQFDIEILIKSKKAGFKIGEVPVIEHKRTHGRSKLSVPYHGFKILSVIIKEMFTKPIK